MTDYSPAMARAPYLNDLNDAQRDAVTHGRAPLLIVAGAGTGKTRTLTHRVAHGLVEGVDPASCLILTFSRRAADEMTRRARHIARKALRARGRHGAVALPYSGTFHAMGHRLVREYASGIGVPPDFTLVDRGDAADLMGVARHEQRVAPGERRFPTKEACLDVYSRCVNARAKLKDGLERWHPQWLAWESELAALFKAYVALKQSAHVLDFDDLLLYWYVMCQNEDIATQLGERFGRVFIDEYQDTNVLQAGIVTALKPDGSGVTAVGDDAQSIYGFRGASVRNMLDFPNGFSAPVTVVRLTRNYRSQPAVLDLSNALMADASEGFSKTLTSERPCGRRPNAVRVEDEQGQANYVADQILARREKGVTLMQQAVLFRNSQHAHALELELGRRDIPFVKYGGLKFLESAHVKDLMAIVRFALNPRERAAAHRVFLLMPGVGPARAGQLWQWHEQGGHDFARLADGPCPKPAASCFAALCRCLSAGLADEGWPAFFDEARGWYEPFLRERFESPEPRLADLDHLSAQAARTVNGPDFAARVALDPPSATSDLAGPPRHDDDYLVLSTVHSAKGLEWDSVYVLNVVDGTFPSEFACGDASLIEEERRLLYVALTRARNRLHLVHPLRFFVTHQPRLGSRHVFSAPSRFMTPALLDLCDRTDVSSPPPPAATLGLGTELDIPGKVRELWP
ncbi:MAG: ATP-dependent helicase [Pseudomonadota bacterium]